MKFRECRRGPGERVCAGEEAQRHPLGRAEFAIIALGLHEPAHQHLVCTLCGQDQEMDLAILEPGSEDDLKSVLLSR